MTRVVAIANQKGGVAKTTTVHALGVAMAERGRRVLLVDLDPQASLTWACGVDPDALERLDPRRAAQRRAEASARRPSAEGGRPGCTCCRPPSTWPAPSCTCSPRPGREYVLRKALSKVADRYDRVLIDCPPSLGILTINGLTAADEVLIPLQCESLSQRGVGQLLETIEDVRDYTNADLAGARAPSPPCSTGAPGWPTRWSPRSASSYDIAVFEPVRAQVGEGGRGARPRPVGAHPRAPVRAAEAYRELADRAPRPSGGRA